MPAATQITDQLPPGAQIANGDNPRNAVGVIDASLYEDSDVLANQARLMARARKGLAYEDGASFTPQFLQRVRDSRRPAAFAGMNSETLNSLMQGQLQRDQQYVGNNTDWTGYYLEDLAKYIVPFDTPLRNMLPRTSSVGIDVENWRAITDVFGGTGPSLSNFILQQQGTPGEAQYVWSPQSNLLRMLSFRDVVTFESELYGHMFEPDVRAKVAAKLAPSLMLGQEVAYINGQQKLWNPPSPISPSTTTTGGTVLAGTYWFLVTAVSANGETLANGGSSAVAISQVTTGTTSTISFTIFRVPNATKYNVYCGSGATQPANSAMWLQGAAAQFGGANALNDPGGYSAGYFTVTMTAAPATSGTAYSTVVTAGNTATVFQSTNPPANQTLMFDGLQSLAYVASGALSSAGVGGETAVIKTVASASGALAKSDIDGWLESMYFNGRANPECLLVGIKDHKALSNIVYNATNFRVNAQSDGAGLSDMVGGARATKWINQTTGRLMDIIMLPYLMQGTIMALSLTLPFTVAEIDKPPVRISVNREMWAVEYPPDQSHLTQWQYATFTNETVVNQYLAGTGVLNGIVTA